MRVTKPGNICYGKILRCGYCDGEVEVLPDDLTLSPPAAPLYYSGQKRMVECPTSGCKQWLDWYLNCVSDIEKPNLRPPERGSNYETVEAWPAVPSWFVKKEPRVDRHYKCIPFGSKGTYHRSYADNVLESVCLIELPTGEVFNVQDIAGIYS